MTSLCNRRAHQQQKIAHDPLLSSARLTCTGFCASSLCRTEWCSRLKRADQSFWRRMHWQRRYGVAVCLHSKTLMHNRKVWGKEGCSAPLSWQEHRKRQELGVDIDPSGAAKAAVMPSGSHQCCCGESEIRIRGTDRSANLAEGWRGWRLWRGRRCGGLCRFAPGAAAAGVGGPSSQHVWPPAAQAGNLHHRR